MVAEGGSLYHMDMNLVADGSRGIEHNIPTLAIYDDVLQFWGVYGIHTNTDGDLWGLLLPGV